ncbi:MAG: hypothetical protein GF401_11570 [Chitinivibrionales bacterium]|nr:hypothetical protein [Chitinivibrionales bacterium]
MILKRIILPFFGSITVFLLASCGDLAKETVVGCTDHEHDHSISATNPSVSYQGQWRWCKNCKGLWFSGHTSGGKCPYNNSNHSFENSYQYILEFGSPGHSCEIPGRQCGWRFCNKCKGLFYSAYGNGVCKAGGSHDGSSSGEYVLPLSSQSTPYSTQGNWKWCNKCQGLVHVDGSGIYGLCPAGGNHDVSSSGSYHLFNAETRNGFRYCKNCKVLWDGSFSRNACPVTGFHSQEGSGNYLLDAGVKTNLLYTDMQPGWKMCYKCSNIIKPGTSPGECCVISGSDQHEFYSDPDYALRTSEMYRAQGGWKQCIKCNAIVYAGGTAGPCKAGGNHTYGSTEYYLRYQ